MAGDGSVRSVERMRRILAAFTEEGQLTLHELTVASGLPKSTLHRFVQGMVRAGMLAYDETRQRYGLGALVLQLGNLARSRINLLQAAQAPLGALREATGETSMLKVVDGDYAVTIEVVRGVHKLGPLTAIGDRLPLHAGASAHALLAYMTDSWIDEYVARTGLPRLTPETITDPEQLRTALEKVRKDGFAVTFGQALPGAASLAVPVRDFTGRVVASISISAPATRLTPDRVDELLVHVQEAGNNLSLSLGFTEGMETRRGVPNLSEIMAS